MPFDPHHILAPDGPIARRLGGRFERRPEQAQMIDAVRGALAKGEKLVVNVRCHLSAGMAQPVRHNPQVCVRCN